MNDFVVMGSRMSFVIWKRIIRTKNLPPSHLIRWTMVGTILAQMRSRTYVVFDI